jgi:hypothetical protein
MEDRPFERVADAVLWRQMWLRLTDRKKQYAPPALRMNISDKW